MSKFQQAQIDQLTAELEFSADAFADSTNKWLEMHSALLVDRDKWKRRALEAEEALRSLGPVLNAEARDKIMEEAHSAQLISEANPDDKYDRLFAGGLAILLELDRKVSAAVCMNSINSGKNDTV